MISTGMNKQLNDQIDSELLACQAYLAMSCVLDGMGLKNLAGRFRKQADEERGHAMKILDYVLEVGGTVTLGALSAPTSQFASVVAIAEAALAHEQKVTRQINDLVALAERENDYATRSFLQWFVDEQVEEIASATHFLQLARMAGPSLLQLEAYAARTGD